MWKCECVSVWECESMYKGMWKCDSVRVIVRFSESVRMCDAILHNHYYIYVFLYWPLEKLSMKGAL